MDKRTDIFFDFEFIDDGKEIVPISVGMCTNAIALTETAPEVVAGRKMAGDRVQLELYIEYAFDPARCNDWVRENVFPHLESTASPHSLLGDGYERYGAATQIREWVADVCGDIKPQFWGYYPSYDWVLLCQHYGTMMHLPKGWPIRPECLMQLADHLGVPKDRFPKQAGQEHNALADAKWHRELFDYLYGFRAGNDLRLKSNNFDGV